MPNKQSQFWQELKRRNVVRVITVYAASAFVILELVDIITEPFGLPNWTLKFVVVILSVGLIVAVILSWIYDIHPEGGIVKTKPVQKVKPDEISKSSNNWKIASYISFVVIVGLMVLNIIPRTKGPSVDESLEKSIAVLPFINDSPEKENEYFLNGIMEELLIKLQTIEDLRVVSRSSVEQFRDQKRPPITEIAEKLDVNYIVEGSGQKYGNTFILRIQLIKGANDDHLWAKSYEEQLESVEVVTRIHAEIAESIAEELEVLITPEEKQIIEKIPTTSLTAFDFYQRGKEEHRKYNFSIQNNEVLERAEALFHYAIDNDSTFAKAYLGLAGIYWDKHFWADYYSEDFLDSVLILADIALSFDKQLAEAYVAKGRYYHQFNKRKQAFEVLVKAIELNPNDWIAYNALGGWYRQVDIIEAINYYHKAASLNSGSELNSVLRNLSEAYIFVGLMEKAKFYIREILKLDGDSVEYYYYLSKIEYALGNFNKAIELGERGFTIDSTHINTLSNLVFLNLIHGQYEESLNFYTKALYELEKVSMSRVMRYGFRGGFIYSINGLTEEANHYLNGSIEILNKEKEIAKNEPSAQLYYDLAAAYAIKGEKPKVYENLKLYDQKPIFSLDEVTRIKNDPLFSSIRDEPEFQQIVRDVETKYQAEHDRVRQWLEKNELL